MSARRPVPLLAAVAVALLLVGGCAGDGSSDDTSDAGQTTTEAVPPDAPSTLAVTTTDYAYALDTETVAEGLVTVDERNEGEENHQVTLIRLEATQTSFDLADALEAQGDVAAAPDAYAGGTNNTVAGGTNSATVPLTEGTYALICFIPNQEGESHFTLGMVGQVDVVPGAGEPVEDPPQPIDDTIAMQDFAFDPPGFATEGMIEVVNEGTQPHEWTVSNLDNTVGTGLAAIAPGATAYVHVDLPEGDYTYNCFVTDPESGAPHIALGMTAEVTLPGG